MAIAASAFGESVDYLKQIKPLLKERCYACHGALKQKNDLRVDTVAAILKGGKNGPAIKANEPEKSLLIERVSTRDLDERMPPEHEGQPFDPAQIQLLRDWIAAGAPAPENEKGETDPKDHWAFREIVRPAVPQVNTKWARNPIDAFIAQKHAERDLTPQPEATREVQLRRLYIDLIGLPPTPEENEAFALSDYEATAQRLLKDPRHGERWARHWMDIWRYSDPYGLGEDYRNSQRHIWHFRDWIIESLNADAPYDEMVRSMLAGDELYPNDTNKLRATGLLVRNFYLFNRNQWMEETVEHVSKAFLGLTMNCAKCHDHKYDPIRQTDFYQMRAFFEPYQVRLDIVAGQPDVMKDAIPRTFDALLETPTYRFIRGQESQPDKSVALSPAPPRFLSFNDLKIEPVTLPKEASEPERRAWIYKTHLDAAAVRRRTAAEPIPNAKKALIEALRNEADAIASTNAPTSTNRIAARLAVDTARAALNVAEARHELARVEVSNIRRRMEAMQTSWDDATNKIERANFAIISDRNVAVAKAELSLAEAEERLVKAAADKKESVHKEIKDARDALEKARQVAKAEIKPEDKFTPLPGAKWAATRFLSSTADDPAIKFPEKSSGRRSALANWITDPRNPLTARVAVNHIWTRHFGTPLAPITFDLGRKAPAPAHPELIDWLAAELIESGWSMKHIHELIVNSATYRMSSSLAGGEANAARDMDNVYLWRRNPTRLEAEAIRDSMLSLAGVLDPSMGGPSVPPDKQNDSKRRSLYFFHSNNDRHLFLTTFDAANVRECYRRDQSIVPQQALALSNSQLAIDSAGLIAKRFASTDDETFIHKAMRTILAIEPSAAELTVSKNALEALNKEDAENARAHFIWALLNHNDFVTLR